MKRNRRIFVQFIIVILLVWASTRMGIFYCNNGYPRLEENLYGVTVHLFGEV